MKTIKLTKKVITFSENLLNWFLSLPRISFHVAIVNIQMRLFRVITD